MVMEREARLLAVGAASPGDLTTPELKHSSSLADVLRASLVASVGRLVAHDLGVRTGDDAEDVHQMRVASRRLRSDLRTFRPVLDEEWMRHQRAELKWLGGVLGKVRDADVLVGRFRDQAQGLPEGDAAEVEPVLGRLVRQRASDVEVLRQALSGDRYLEIVGRLAGGPPESSLRPEAHRRATHELPRLVARPWRKLRQAVKGLPDEPTSEDLHEVRILTKRVRYASEAAAPVVGKPAKRLAKAAAGLQGVLGDHQDAIVAEDWLRRAATDATGVQVLAIGELVAVQRAEAAACRRAWPEAWSKVDRKKRRSWLT
jgi:CHAD domain-containing protein